MTRGRVVECSVRTTVVVLTMVVISMMVVVVIFMIEVRRFSMEALADDGMII